MTRSLAFVARLAVRQTLAQRGALIARGSFYALLLLVFSRLWEALLPDLADTHLRPADLVWYMTITEWIVFSVPPLHTDLEDDLRRGDLAYRLARPVPYPAIRLAHSGGELLVRMLVLGVMGLVAAWLLTGRLPHAPHAIAWLLPLAALAMVLQLLLHFAIGLSAFWLHDCRPIYWVWQKGLFIFGGLMIPLPLYPPWLQRVAELTPFSAVLYGPASLVLGTGSPPPAGVLVSLLLWLVITTLVVRWLFARATRRLELGGG